MSFTYSLDKKVYLPFRTNSNQLKKIENYRKTHKILGRSEAIRELIDIALSVPSPILADNEEMPKTQIIETEVIEKTEKITREKTIILDNIEAIFPRNLIQLFIVECDDKNAFLKTKHWIPKEDWKKINNIVKKHDGEWISSGNESHWIMPLNINK